MKNLLRAGVLAMLGAFASNEVGHAQGVSEPGPYYALPSWDQQLPASTRWITLTNWSSAAVLDRETGLVWQQNPGANGSDIWTNALVACQSIAFGGRFGWRLPSVEELITLLDPTTMTLFAGSPLTLPATNPAFWTATTLSSNTDLAEYVSFVTQPPGSISSPVAALNKANAQRFWCVRGYQGTQNPQ